MSFEHNLTCPAMEVFYRNLQEVYSLETIYERVPDGQPDEQQVLVKSSIIFIVTSLDAFFKQLVTDAFDAMLRSSKLENHPNLLPDQVKTVVSEHLLETSDHPKEAWCKDKWRMDIWQLAGEGWLTLLKQHREVVMQRYVERFQSVRRDNIDNLFKQVIGFKQLSVHWKWHKMSDSQVLNCLNTLMDLRGDLVHRNLSHRPVTKTDIDYFAVFAEQLAVVSTNAVREYLYTLLGEYSWEMTPGTDSGKVLGFEASRCTPKTIQRITKTI